ncbi:MAG: CPBP family intramembrane metalloprotease [Thermoplasmata archaeon]|nr:CPBP family intramembrane metalloprotease [Thermoplasmata archaeon]
MLTLVDLYFSCIIVIEILVTLTFLLLRGKIEILKDNLRFYIDIKVIIETVTPILAIAYLISILIPSQRIEIPSLLVLSIFIAPIFEEIFFRGLLIGTIHSLLTKRKDFDRKNTALLLITINPFIFAAWHILNTFTFQIQGFIIKLATGFIFAMFYWYGKRNLIPVITAHAIYNLFVCLNLFKYI